MQKAVLGSEKVIGSVRDLKVYQQSYLLAMRVFELSKRFPKEETYSLTDQIRRSSRAVAIDIREGFAKKKYRPVFLRFLNDALGSSNETRGWLDFSRDCGYLSSDEHQHLDRGYDEVNAMLYGLSRNWRDFSETESP